MNDADAFVFVERPVDVKLDRDAYEATIDGVTLRVGDGSDFQYAVWAVLVALYDNPRRVFGRDTLLKTVGVSAEDPRSMDTHIKRLRKVTKPLGVDLVRTVNRVGYIYDPRRIK